MTADQPTAGLDVEAVREPWRAFGQWIAVPVGECTCGPDDWGHHEQGCGYEPIGQAESEAVADLITAQHNDALEAVTRERDEARAEGWDACIEAVGSVVNPYIAMAYFHGSEPPEIPPNPYRAEAVR